MPEVTVTGMHSGRNVPAATFPLGALAIAALAIAAALATRGGEAPGVPTERSGRSTALVLAMLERCTGDLHCVETSTDDLIGALGVDDVALAAANVYAEDPLLAPECHTYMHMIGAHLAAEVERGQVPRLEDTWTACGSGLVHGVFAAIPLDESDPARVERIADLCEGEEFAAPMHRYHACLHALGHGIHAGVDGDLARAEALCAGAVPRQESFARNDPCLGGVYMVDRDERVAELPVPADAAGWSRILGHCAGSTRPDVCTASYFELSTRHGTASTLAYLDWCLSVGEERECVRQLGQGGALQQLGGAREPAAATCAEAAARRGLEPDPCTEGIRDALLARGTPPERLATETCRLLRESGGICPN